MQPGISALVPVRADFERCLKKAGAKRDPREQARAPRFARAKNKIEIKRVLVPKQPGEALLDEWLAAALRACLCTI